MKSIEAFRGLYNDIRTQCSEVEDKCRGVDQDGFTRLREWTTMESAYKQLLELRGYLKGCIRFLESDKIIKKYNRLVTDITELIEDLELALNSKKK